MRRAFLTIVLLIFAFSPEVMARDKATTDKGYLGADNWAVDTSGHLLPQSTNNIGSASYPVNALYVTTLYSSKESAVELPIFSGIVLHSTKSLLSASTIPGIEIDNNIPSIVWADGETTPIQVTFRVPADYLSGGAFRVVADQSNTTTACEIDFLVYVNSDAANFDSAATNQTPVALAEAAGSCEQVVLSVATDFASLAAGDIVSLSLWRDNTATGTGDLEIYYAEFYYTAAQ